MNKFEPKHSPPFVGIYQYSDHKETNATEEYMEKAGKIIISLIQASILNKKDVKNMTKFDWWYLAACVVFLAILILFFLTSGCTPLY